MNQEKILVKVRALKVNQDLSVFYSVVLSAETLLKVCYSDVMKAKVDYNGGGYLLEGTQRQIQDKRLKEISKYIDRDDAAFPNSIIIATNINESDGMFSSDLDISWRIEENDQGTWLVIPTDRKVASIIDGQHRLFGFVGANKNKLKMELLCSVYLDLPKPYQAQLFATINSNQKKVDKSLTYELFGYNINDEPVERWSPDKLAVFLTRKLNIENESPFYRRIKLSPMHDKDIAETGIDSWVVSTSTIVEGIIRLISTNPKEDSNLISTPIGQSRSCLLKRKDSSPFRELYIDGQDILIYSAVNNFFSACEGMFWNQSGDTYMKKNVGIQALFDVLRVISKFCIKEKKLSKRFFEDVLEPAMKLDFTSDEFKHASGSGRLSIKNAIVNLIDEKYKI